MRVTGFAVVIKSGAQIEDEESNHVKQVCYLDAAVAAATATA